MHSHLPVVENPEQPHRIIPALLQPGMIEVLNA